MINVTKTFLPPLDNYVANLQIAYKSNCLTNRGKIVNLLEKKVSKYLGLRNTKILITTNGTLPLQISLKLLGKMGEIITTPFSYVATTSSILWENCTPVFVDINPDYLTIDENKIEKAITKRTTCILATHVFGNPCHIDKIISIAKKYNLKVIFDAAHCFGVRYRNKSIFEYGDISTCSFHATKLFHTGEGGAIFCKNKILFRKLFYSHNFGHNGQLKYFGLGINGKISELQAAMGLSVLPYMNNIIYKRKKIIEFYNRYLDFTNIKKLLIREKTDWNYSYYPIIFDSEKNLKQILKRLNKSNIFPRRYFYPSLNKLPFINSKLKFCNSESISKRIICLPLYHNLSLSEVDNICKIIRL